MNKQEQIDAWNKRPIQKGDMVNVIADYTVPVTTTTGRGKNKVTEVTREPKQFNSTGEVVGVFHTRDEDIFAIKFFSTRIPHELEKVTVPGYSPAHDVTLCREAWVNRDYTHCGMNPFKPEPPRMDFFNQEIASLLSNCGYRRRHDDYNKPDYKTIESMTHASEKPFIGCSYGGVNFNPYVTDADGTRRYYQRGLVWTLEQKQALIESIYNWIEIGKFVFRYRSWEQIEAEMKETGHGYNWDCVDGKQRLNAIIEFLQGKFPDIQGNYWNDLSPAAQRHLLGYSKLSFAKMDEGTTDADVVRTFLTLNFTGTPMSPEHIAFVQSIKM